MSKDNPENSPDNTVDKTLQADEERRYLDILRQSSIRFLDKTIITVSSGALVLSFSQIVVFKKMLANFCALKILMSLGWMLLLLAIIIPIIGYYYSSNNYDHVMRLNIASLLKRPHNPADKKAHKDNTIIVERCNIISVISFIAGLLLIAIPVLFWFFV